MPEGHKTTDKTFAYHSGDLSSNPDMTNDFSGPILSGTSAMCTLSLTMPVIMCSYLNICYGGGKKRGIVVKV